LFFSFLFKYKEEICIWKNNNKSEKIETNQMPNRFFLPCQVYKHKFFFLHCVWVLVFFFLKIKRKTCFREKYLCAAKTAKYLFFVRVHILQCVRNRKPYFVSF
jgi:hypothetical protein